MNCANRSNRNISCPDCPGGAVKRYVVQALARKYCPGVLSSRVDVSRDSLPWLYVPRDNCRFRRLRHYGANGLAFGGFEEA